MSGIRMLEDDNAGLEQNNVISGSEQRRVSLTMQELQVLVVSTVEQVIEQKLVPLISRVVKQEIEEKILTSLKQNSGSGTHSSESRSFQLKFLNKLCLPVFTGMQIKGEGCIPLEVALVDGTTGQVVDFGPEASAEVEIVVVEGDFDGDKRSNWTIEEFNNKIVREMKGRKSLLTGNVKLNLKEGKGFVGEISFTHNANWMKSCELRLGAKLVDNLNGTRVREAMTESFVLKDRRINLYKKRHPPSLLDEIWRLEKIGKDGAFHKRLRREKVNTVKDFLTLLFLDPTRLRNILGSGMSAKMWEVAVDHAQTCIIDPRLYFYHPPGSQKETGVVFNVVGKLMGLLSECQYAPVDKLSETEKAEAHTLVIAAVKHWKDVVSFDEASLRDGSSRLFNNVLYSNPAMVETSDGSKILTSSQNIGGLDYPQETLCSPDIMPSICLMGDVNSSDDFGLHNIDNMDIRYDQPLNPGQVTNSPICETESNTQAFCKDEHLQHSNPCCSSVDEHLQNFDPDCSLQSQNSTSESQADLHSALMAFLLARSAAFAQRRWKMLFSVLKWFSIRMTVAKKTHVRQMQGCY